MMFIATRIAPQWSACFKISCQRACLSSTFTHSVTTQTTAIARVKNSQYPTRGWCEMLVAMAPDQIRDPLGKNVSGRGLGWVRHDDSSRAPALWQGCSLRTQSGPDVGFGQVYPYQ